MPPGPSAPGGLGAPWEPPGSLLNPSPSWQNRHPQTEGRVDITKMRGGISTICPSVGTQDGSVQPTQSQGPQAVPRVGRGHHPLSLHVQQGCQQSRQLVLEELGHQRQEQLRSVGIGGAAGGTTGGPLEGHLTPAGCRESRHHAGISCLRHHRPREMRSHIRASHHRIPAPGHGVIFILLTPPTFTGHLLCAKHCDRGEGHGGEKNRHGSYIGELYTPVKLHACPS